jgi:hypothetical protein
MWPCFRQAIKGHTGYRQNADDERPHVFHQEKARCCNGSGATCNAADEGLGAGDIAAAGERAPPRDRDIGKICRWNLRIV